MKISIITVAYNSAATIAETLASVAEQTHRDIEHIVIDGMSNDATLEVIRTHGAHATQVVSEPDLGIYDAMNKGLRLASGDFVGFLNADDTFAHPGSVASIAQAAQQGASVDAVYGDLVYVREDQPDQVLRRWRSGPFAPTRLRFGWMPPHPTFYVKRAFQQQIGHFDTSLRIAADYDFMMRCLTREGVTVNYVREVLVNMRAGGVSNRSLKSMLRKSTEDLAVIRRNHIGGWGTLASKNLRKLPQFFTKRGMQ